MKTLTLRLSDEKENVLHESLQTVDYITFLSMGRESRKDLLEQIINDMDKAILKRTEKKIEESDYWTAAEAQYLSEENWKFQCVDVDKWIVRNELGEVQPRPK